MNQNEETKFGEKIRQIRKMRRLKQSELDAAAGLPTASICKIEAGNRDISAAELMRIGQAMRVPITVFAEDSDTLVLFDEEIPILRAMRLIPDADYDRVLTLVEMATYFLSKTSLRDKKMLRELSESVRAIRLSGSRARVDAIQSKRIRS